MVRVQATDALGDANMPAPLAVARLSALLDDERLQGKASLKLGAVIFNTRDQAPEAAAQGEQALLTRYRAPGGDRTSWLAALGNAGSAALVPDIKDFAKESDVNVRAELVFAARHVRSPEVDAVVQAGLKDKVDRVRFKAAQACSLWAESRPCAGLATAVEREAVASNREVMLLALARGATTAGARARVIKIARAVEARHPDDATRKLVGGLVTALSQAPTATGTSGYAFGTGVNPVTTSGGGKP
jgi:HEAT repeat protein